ncbi:ABC transporter substrate-binding protein [Herbiconiux moechotypicola]|uniref:ABC transporter substrate-binding protein n=1 Tax=Herbiconiux moechotypicola TaxID=637393 RepID=A0ABN3DQ75_9MICO|nr:ABC transporter substrate-binding protein [Herbiconiux moechotypicola]MCS5731679.1 ABC transporter substrate-binding protein [Herbiconiux moechotypicola]
MTRSRRGLLPRALAALALVGLLAACTPAANSTPTDSSSSDASDTLVVAIPALGSKWGMPDTADDGLLPILTNVRATLIRKPYVETGADTVPGQDLYSFGPYLAKSYDVSEDGLTYTFHLRDDITSAAGNPLTVDDVIWSYERKFGAEGGQTPEVNAPAITSASQFSKVDDSTVAVTIASASDGLLLLAVMADYTGYIYDSVLLKEHATADDPYALAWSDSNPNFGFGPYSVGDYVAGQSVDLVKNPGFPSDLGTGPNEVRMRVIPDAGTRFNALSSGDVDMALNLEPQDLAELADSSTITVPTAAKSNAWLIMSMLTNKAPFDDTLVRQAMSYAIPYDQIIDNVYFGRATRGTGGLLDPDAPGYTDENLTVYDYDPAKAKELLAQAGHPDGISFTLTVDSTVPELESAAVQMKTAAAESGLDISIEKVSQSVFFEGRGDHTPQAFLTRDYAISLVPSYELRLYTHPDSRNNLADWTSTEFENLVTAAEAEPDPLSDAAGVKWSAAENYLVNESPLNFVAAIQPALAYSSTVDGFVWRTDQFVDYTQITKSK